MPYLVHPKSWSPATEYFDVRYLPDGITAYPDRASAHAACPPTTHKVSFVLSSSEQSVWHRRERERYRNGTYERVPWAGSCERYDLAEVHFAHLSVEQPGMVAYTPTEEAGVLDKQTRTKPGRYLTQFYKDVFTPEEIQGYIAQCSVSAFELKIARTIDEIRTIFSCKTTGFTSCMQAKEDIEYDWQRYFEQEKADHPAIVYASPDLGIAYRGDLACVKQRVVVWPDKKIYNKRSDGKIYGDGCLVALLEKAGYRPGKLTGARILRMPHFKSGAYLMPYIDNEDYVSDDCDSRYLVLGRGSIDCQTTVGYAYNKEDETYTCRYCERDCDEDGGLCSRCEDRVWVCDYCNEEYFSDDQVDVSGQTWCDYCAGSYASRCQADDCETRWVESREFSQHERDDRRAHDLTGYCRTCARERETESDEETTETETIDPYNGETIVPRDVAERRQNGITLQQAMSTGRWVTLASPGVYLLAYYRHTIDTGARALMTTVNPSRGFDLVAKTTERIVV
jgi:hypothetical protein